MIICLSGRYIDRELALHYGRIPPSFLPLGGQRLFERQFSESSSDEPRILTLPKDFEIGEKDCSLIKKLGITVLKAEPELSLSEAIRMALEHASEGDTIKLLFGDTLVDLPNKQDHNTDYVVVDVATVDYPWCYANKDDFDPQFFGGRPTGNDTARAVCGYFEFSNLGALRDAFQQPSLHEALNAYHESMALTLVNAETWYDFGHIALFYRSRRNALVARSFNSISVENDIITKTSKNSRKMFAEASWYEALPQNLSIHTPRYLGKTHQNYQVGYRLEYLFLPSVSDMAVFGNQGYDFWHLLLNKCVELLSTLRGISPPAQSPELSPGFAEGFFTNMLEQKTWSRLDQFLEGVNFDFSTELTINGEVLPPLRNIVQETIQNIPKTTSNDIGFLHGDFFFGNLLFDLNAQRILMIDPRGEDFTGNISQFGDVRYDLGKLAHSVLGGYDHIIMNRFTLVTHTSHSFDFSLELGNNTWEQVQNGFCETIEKEFGLDRAALYSLAAIMFFSMLPLHEEDVTRQHALLLNGLRLWKNAKG